MRRFRELTEQRGDVTLPAPRLGCSTRSPISSRRSIRRPAASLREGLDETLTVMRFKLPTWLERTLSTTNAIEFVNSRIRKATHNVTKWNGGTMVLRWLAVALGEASKTFRKLRGYKGMPALVAALRAHDATL